MSEDLWGEVPQLDDQAQRALAEAEKFLGGDVQGVAIGATDAGDPCVVFYVVDTGAGAVPNLPSECGGLPTTVTTGDAFSAED